MTRTKTYRSSEPGGWFAIVIWMYAGGGGIGVPALIWWGQDHYFLGVPPQPANPGWQHRCIISVAMGLIGCIIGFWVWWRAWRRPKPFIIQELP